jgi:signal transduction histidine kinase
VPVFVLSGSADGPTQVQRGNGAASQWLGLAPTQLAGLAFADLQSRLPQAVQTTLARAFAAPDGAGEPPVRAGWDVRVRPIDGGRDAAARAERRWVLTLAPGAGAEAAPAAGREEHESFSYTVSHDLRAPIRVVEGFTKILKEDYGRQLDRIGNDHLDRVLGAAARMNNMVDALLTLSQLSARPLLCQPVNLSQLAGFVIEDLRRQSPERTVEVAIQAGLQTQGDPTLLRLVLENLLGNAWKYSARKQVAQIWLESGVVDGRAVYTVRDNGAGFDMRFADRLFGVFQRLHSANDFPGTGVGLASVRRIVIRHGGDVWAESEVGRGSSFHFTLPAGGGEARNGAPAMRAPRQPGLQAG